MAYQSVFYLGSAVTTVILICSGFAVLAFGDWRKFKLKFAGVALTTTAALFLFVMSVVNPAALCTAKPLTCLTWQLFGVTRNIAFIIFVLAIGRDAIKLKNWDRRNVRLK